jgi:hypothetical protein
MYFQALLKLGLKIFAATKYMTPILKEPEIDLKFVNSFKLCAVASPFFVRKLLASCCLKEKGIFFSEVSTRDE